MENRHPTVAFITQLDIYTPARQARYALPRDARLHNCQHTPMISVPAIVSLSKLLPHPGYQNPWEDLVGGLGAANVRRVD